MGYDLSLCTASDEQLGYVLAQDALADVKALHGFPDLACRAKLGMIWFWG
jgi:hypothetical protein